MIGRQLQSFPGACSLFKRLVALVREEKPLVFAEKQLDESRMVELRVNDLLDVEHFLEVAEIALYALNPSSLV